MASGILDAAARSSRSLNTGRTLPLPPMARTTSDYRSKQAF
jgi:hypothetical protein